MACIFHNKPCVYFRHWKRTKKTTVFMHRKIVTDIHKNTFRILRAAHCSCKNMFFIKHIG